MLIGGVFGIFAHIVQTLLAHTGITVDTVAFTVVISNIIVRIAQDVPESKVFSKESEIHKDFLLIPNCPTICCSDFPSGYYPHT